MRKLLGFALLIAGMAFGAFAFYPDSIDREEHLAELTAIMGAAAGGASRKSDPASTGALRNFAPANEIIIPKPAQQRVPASAPRARTELAEAPTVLPSAAPALAPPPIVPAPVASAPVAVAPAPATGWQPVVTRELDSVASGVTSSKPGDDHARYELVMSLQRELKRAGCYGGTLSGAWTVNTRRAMAAYMERVNSTLPIEEPDYILLTLLRANTSASCGQCPSGQTYTDGRCVPKAIVAQAGRKTGKPEPSKPESQFTTTIAAAEPENRGTASRPAPLPGRMSIGGPVPPPPAQPAPAAGSTWNIKVMPTPAQGTPSPSRTAALDKVETGSRAEAPSDAGGQGLVPLVAAPVPAPASGLEDDDADAAGAGSASAAAAVDDSLVPRGQRASRERSRSASPSKPQRASNGNRNRRSVQSLFTHPLGRM